MEAKVLNQQGKETGKVTLPESVFGLSWNGDLVHQVVTSMLSTARDPIAHTKMRGEVRGGGKKPWKQKGTGRARHGSTRSPIWVGGGVTHGPRNDKNYNRKVNKKMKAKAVYTILSKKMKDGQIIFVDSVAVADGKSKNALEILKALGLAERRNKSAYIAFGKKDAVSERAFSNFGNVVVDEVRNINPVDILQYKYVVITDPTASVAFLESKMESKK